MNKIRSSLWKINRTGNLVFPDDERNLKCRFSPKSRFESETAVFIIMIVCCVLDVVMFTQLFNHLIFDSAVVRYGAVIGMLMPFDLAPIYFGMKLREKHQGYKVHNWMLVGLLAAFLAGIILYFWLRITLRDSALPMSTQKTLSFSSTPAEPASNPYAWIFAIFTGVMPLLTSMVSLWVSYSVSDPLKKELHALEKQRLHLEREYNQINSVLREYESDLTIHDRLLKEDEVKYSVVCNQVDRLASFYADYVRERIKEHLGEPAATNELSKTHSDNFLSQLEKRYHDLIMEGER